MVRAIEHRGPDQSGVLDCGSAVLGACRLRIVDLGPRSDQPFVLDDGDWTLVYNGEVFNYRELRRELEEKEGTLFETAGDTEVVARAWQHWGPGCVERFIGQWALAVWDGSELWLSRDRMGEKPLYYAESGTRFLFCSEIKGLLEHVAIRPNRVALEGDVLSFEATRPPDTWFEGIHEVIPGTNVRLAGGSCTGHRYWSLPEPDPALATADPDTLAEELRSLLIDAVRCRLVADVPVGIALSGGVDSAAIACIAAEECGQRLDAFSCRFPLGVAFDEHRYAEITARRACRLHTTVSPTVDDFREQLGGIIRALDQPVATASPIGDFAVARAARDAGVKVLLSGQGSDEAFGGYTRHLLLAIHQWLQELDELANYHGLARQVWPALGDDPATVYTRFLHRAGDFDRATEEVRRLFGPHEPIAGACRTDLALVLPSLIAMNDRSCASVGIENRNPFLDHRIAEFGARLPDRFRVVRSGSRWWTKSLLRRAVAGIIPPEIADRRDKKGLVVPFGPWLGDEGPLESWGTAVAGRGSRFAQRWNLPPRETGTDSRGAFSRARYMGVCFGLWAREFFD